MKISLSKLANEQKKALIREFPGLRRHFSELEKAIETNPEDGNKEFVLTRTGRYMPVRTIGAVTEIFGGMASYSKELVAVYLCSEDFSLGRVVQYLF